MKSIFELASRMNQINKEIDKLEIEYNSIVNEIKSRLPQLKEDANLQPKVYRKKKNRMILSERKK